jgi:hypothetical protein
LNADDTISVYAALDSITSSEKPRQKTARKFPLESTFDESWADIEERTQTSLDDETRRSIRSNRATWWPLPRTSITSVQDLTTTARDGKRDRGTGDYEWVDLKENKELEE